MGLKKWMGGIRGKLIAIFVVIKVVPLLLLAMLAWNMAQRLGETVSEQAGSMAESMLSAVKQVGDAATDDAIKALDDRAREGIERLTTDTARAVAAFLYDRDADVLQAAQVEPGEAAFRSFLTHRARTLYHHGEWQLAEDQKRWAPAMPEAWDEALAADAKQALVDNAKAFSARPPEYLGQPDRRPLFVEMTFVDLQGRERVKVTTGDLMSRQLRDVSKPAETFLKAERYWPDLQKLKPGDIYVSEVIGAYVGSRVIGPYLPASAQKAGVEFKPEESAYAGTENPVGRHFRGIVRWATPVVKGGKVSGYVTLALDHDHIRQFTDRISPTDTRYTPINDAIVGNYAFMWDHKSRAISHPRDYFIPGYDPQTGEPVTPWLDQSLFDAWQASGKPSREFLDTVTPFDGQSLKKKPAGAMVKAGTVALDCRYLNFSPQCAGWNQLTEKGGSGSFVIFFSGLWKLTTAAAIPYYTGQYGETQRGFGFVTIGANVDDFHRAATESAKRIGLTIAERDRAFQNQRQGLLEAIEHNLTQTAGALTVSTLLMVGLVIIVAIWMAQFMTRRITDMIHGLGKFQSGDLAHRLEVKSGDEMGQLAQSFNSMADEVQESFKRSEEGRTKAEEANKLKSDFLANMSHELRTPLNGILGYSELLQMELEDPAQQDYAATIHSSGEHLLDIVNDLLDLAKVEAGRIELKPVEQDVARLANDLVGTHRAHAQAKGLGMVLEMAEDLPATIFVDAQRVRQILNNLLNNAIKFTDNGKVGLSVRREGERLAFAVSDTGRGIPAEALEHIFEKFRQLDQFVTRDHGGTGLGLALAREFAHLLSGDLVVESRVGEGSTFTLFLPLTGQSS
ncbi:MAG: ATP-binding protein [Zoogloea oleivorans]|jgi:signal transduction histidine kinase|uniref:sensor histidine kinase n=1 Tax=Zoogloea oleivorans TaxID=1552750 RepID=UPI002A359239|nr:ATP-binding protein [Zoogloea oleivorans]MDY0038285.1 ATP-binding protein [Zoogloea oleivorans]